MKRLLFVLIITIFLVEAYGFAPVRKNNKAVKSIQDTLFTNAEEILKSSLEDSPDNPILNYNYGLVKLRQFEEYNDKIGLESAVESFEKAKTDTTKSNLQAINYNQANAYFNQGDYANAANAYQKSGTYLDSTDVDPDLLYNYANSLYKFAEANPEYDSLFTVAQNIYKSTSSIVDNVQKQKIWHNLGNSSFQQKQYQEAISYYIEALKLDPNSEDTRINYEIALRKLAEQESKGDQKEQKEDKKDDSDNQQEKSENQQQEQQKQQEEAKEKQEQYDELSQQEKNKLDAEKKLDALLQQQSRPEENDEKPMLRPKRPSGRYW